MIIFGIDPGTELHGWAMLEGNSFETLKVGDCGHDFADKILDSILPMDWDNYKCYVEKPNYQGPLRTQATILETSFWAGFFKGSLHADELYPKDWKKALWGKGSGVTESMVALYVQNKFARLPKMTVRARPHVYDAIVVALAGALTAGFR